MHFFKSSVRYLRTLLSSGIFLLIILGLPSMRAEASEFTHSHDESCYKKVTHTCSNHHIEVVYNTENHWCVHCQAWPSSSVTSYYEICDSGLIADRWVGEVVRCDVCGKYTANSPVHDITPHTYETTEFVCTLNEGECLADVNCIADSVEWTNDSVLVNCVVNIKSNSFSLASQPYDWGGGYTKDSSVRVSENGTYTVAVKDSKGNTVQASATVSCIDKVAPSVTLRKSTEGWSEEGIDIFAEASDEQSGLSDNPYALDGGTFGTERVWHIEKNGTYSVTVCDRAGNTTTETIVIDKIGRDPEVVAAEAKKAEEERLKAEEERLKAEAEARVAQANREAEEARIKAAEYEAAKAAEDAKIAEEQAKKAEAEAQKAKEEKEKAKAEKEKAKAEKERAQAEKEKAEAEAQAAEEARLKEEAELITVTDMMEEVTGDITVEQIAKEEVVSETVTEVVVTEEILPEETISEIYDFSNIQGDKYVDEALELETKKASVGVSVIYVGAFLAVCGLIFFSFFNYIYVSRNGHKRVLTLVKVKVENSNVLVIVPEGKVKEPGRYMIYFSPWSRSKIKKRGVYVKNGTSPTVIPVDEGKVFSIKG